MVSNGVSIIFSHPNPKSFIVSIAHDLKRSIEDRRKVYMQDLYQDAFAPVLDMTQLQRHLAIDDVSLRYAKEAQSSSILLFLYPLWWGMPPAIMKGWLDKLLMPGFAFAHNVDAGGFSSKGVVTRHPLFSKKSLFVMYTADDLPEPAYIQSQWQYIANYIGLRSLHVQGIGNIRETSLRERRAFIKQAVSTLSELEQEG